MAVPAADSLTPMTAVISVGSLVIMPTTVIVSARGVVDAAGQHPALGPDLGAGATALVAVAMKEGTVHLHTQNVKAGQVLRAALDPEPLCGAHVHLYAGQKALSEGPDPEHLSVETVAPVHDLVLGRGNVVCPDLALGLVRSVTKKMVIPGLPPQGEVQHRMLTDLNTDASPPFPTFASGLKYILSPHDFSTGSSVATWLFCLLPPHILMKALCKNIHLKQLILFFFSFLPIPLQFRLVKKKQILRAPMF